MRTLWAGSSRRRFAVLAAALAACNTILGNENGTSREEQDAGAVRPDAESSSGNGASSSSGVVPDAAVLDGGSTTTTCPDGETAGFCDPLPLEPLLMPGEFNTSEFKRIAANDAYLFVTSNDETTIRFGLDENDDPVSYNTVSSDPALRMITTPVARLGEGYPENPLFDAPSELRLCSSGGPPTCNLLEQTTSASRLVPARGGVLALRTTPVGLIYASGPTVTTLESLEVDQAAGLPVAANHDTAFFVNPVFGAVRTVKRCRYLPDKQEKAALQLDVLENPAFLAANDELLFFSPCGNNTVCAVDAKSVTGMTPSRSIVGATESQAGLELFVDATRLVTSNGTVTSVCNTSACALEVLTNAPMLSTTRNSRSLFVLAGSSIWQAKRTPLHPSP